MNKFITTLLLLLLCFEAVFAQNSGIKGTVVSRQGRAPIEEAVLSLKLGETQVATYKTGKDGVFEISGLENGRYTLDVSAPEFISAIVNVTLEGYVRDLVFISLTPSQTVKDMDDSSFAEFDMDDSGYTDTPTILFGSNDVYSNVAGYGFSAIRFKNRGYDNEKQKVYLAGVELNDALTGYSPYSLWSGLNEAMRSKETTIGLETSDNGVGGISGITSIAATPSSVRPGWRFSILSNSALYRLRLMANYASGQLDNGWSYAINASVRAGGNDWVEGVFYRSFSLYAGAEKKIDDANRIALIAFAAPGQRGAQNASTQEVYDLMGDNMYNSNWGYQNGKVRNSRVRKTFEPVVALKYDYTPSVDFNASATLLYRTGWNGYTSLDWYDAMDPRPDYYRNLPSYSYMEDEDFNRKNEDKYEWARYAWTAKGSQFDNYKHINWDRLYNVNYNNPEGRSKYAQEERHVDQNDLNFAASMKWRQSDFFTLCAGMDLRYNSTEYYKKMNDLLGGQYFLNVDQFAERDFASNEAKIQNDLDYWLANGSARKIKVGDKYGYDYMAEVRKAKAWTSATFTRGGFKAVLAGTVGYEAFWRNGLVRKGLFAGLDDNGNPYEGLTTTDELTGEVITSKGKSEVSSYLTYSGKLALEYVLKGGHRFSANAGYFNDAPTFNQAFLSARTRNTLVYGLSPIKTASADVNYQYSNSGYDLRVTGFYTTIKDQTDVMSFYNDAQQSFTNFASSGIDQRHMGIEIGLKVPLFLEGLSMSWVLSAGEYIYTSTPFMVQTVDNSAELVGFGTVSFWKKSPVYKKETVNGVTKYALDGNGAPILEGYQKHYVPSTPQLASELAFNYRTKSYWFFEINGQYFDNAYLEMNPLYRTDAANKGAEFNPTIVEDLASQDKFDPAFLLNASLGKSWYLHRKYNFGFSLEIKNALNNKNVKTGGYEQTRLTSSYTKDRYFAFDPKYFYMPGANYMLNLYFRF